MVATGGYGHTVEAGLHAIGKGEEPRLVLVLRYGCKAVLRLLLNAQLCGKPREAIDDAVRALRHRERTLVLLCGKPHALALEPLVCAAVVEPLKQTLHKLVPSWISLLGVANALERVGKVAASTASDLYLCQHLLVFLKYSDVCRWTVAFGLYGGKVAGSAATDDAMWSGGLVIYIF